MEYNSRPNAPLYMPKHVSKLFRGNDGKCVNSSCKKNIRCGICKTVNVKTLTKKSLYNQKIKNYINK